MYIPSGTILSSSLRTLEAAFKDLQEVILVKEYDNVLEEIPRPPPLNKWSSKLNWSLKGTYQKVNL